MALVFRGSRQKFCLLPHLSLLLLILAAGLFGGCRKQLESESTPGVAIHHQIAPDPPQVGSDTITLTLADATASPIAKAHVGLEADMQHPGMVPHPYPVSEIEPGRYQARVQFDMAGDWVILLHIVLPDGNSVNRQFDVPGVRPR